MAGTQNITEDFRERQYAAYANQSAPASWFRHTSPTYTGPTAIVFPGTLNGPEQIEVRAWLVASETDRPKVLANCTQRAAIAKITEYIAFYDDPDWLAWSDANQTARIAQWKLFMADGLVQSKLTVTASGDILGLGSLPISPPITQAENMTD